MHVQVKAKPKTALEHYLAEFDLAFEAYRNADGVTQKRAARHKKSAVECALVKAYRRHMERMNKKDGDELAEAVEKLRNSS